MALTHVMTPIRFAPGIEDGFRRLVETIRPTGMKLFQQLRHAGHNAVPFDGSVPDLRIVGRIH